MLQHHFAAFLEAGLSSMASRYERGMAHWDAAAATERLGATGERVAHGWRLGVVIRALGAWLVSQLHVEVGQRLRIVHRSEKPVLHSIKACCAESQQQASRPARPLQ